MPQRSGGASGACRIALSGAPVENRVPELHSHLEFTMNGYLGSEQAAAANCRAGCGGSFDFESIG